MRHMFLAALLLAPGLAAAQTAPAAPAEEGRRTGVRLPEPSVPDNAPPSVFIAAARQAIAAGRLGEAMEAIERGESRLLVRSVRPSRASISSDQALVRLLAGARAALQRGDRDGAVQMLGAALADKALDRPPD